MPEPGAKDTVAVTLNAPRALGERLIDWLLEREDAPGFTSYLADGHSARPAKGLSVAEQVSGRQRRIELRIELPADALDRFLADLQATYVGADLYYFVTPLLRTGSIGGAAT
jgi:hypothetical protein